MEVLILLFVVVVGVSFLCSVLESVILSTNISYIYSLEKKDPTRGALLKKLKIDIDKSVLAILILNTIVTVLGSIAIGLKAQIVFQANNNVILLGSIAFMLLFLFVARVIPRTLGVMHWKSYAPTVAIIIKYLIILTTPIIIVAQIINKKLAHNKKLNKTISKEELLHSTLLSKEEGIIGRFESDIIKSALTLSNIKIKNILTPRSVMYAIKKDTLIKDILEDKRTYKFSRVPVYDETIDHIVGVILTKRLFKQAVRNQDSTVESIMVPISTLNENIPVSKALNIFLKKREHMFLVLDSYDQTEGIVTLEDCIETLLGIEIMDESDTIDDMRKLAAKQMKKKRKDKDREIKNKIRLKPVKDSLNKETQTQITEKSEIKEEEIITSETI